MGSMLVEKSKEVNCKIDVLTDLFNKKETEMQLNLRQQSSLVNEYTMKVNDVKEIFQKTLSENDSVEEEVLEIRGKISQCESELKVEIAEKEKEAHESWMKCKQSDSVCNELQKELEILKSRLNITRVFSRTEISDQTEDGTSDSSVQPHALQDLPPLPGLPPFISTTQNMTAPFHSTPPQLPPLPGLMSQSLASYQGLPHVNSTQPNWPIDCNVNSFIPGQLPTVSSNFSLASRSPSRT